MTIRHRTIKAGRWTGISAAICTLSRIAQTIVLARILAPADFGLMAIAASVIAVVAIFADLGFSRSIIHFEKLTQTVLSSLFWITVAAGLFLSIAFFVIAPLMATAFNMPGLTGVLIAISPIFFITSLGQLLRTLAERDFNFRTLAINECAAALLGLTAGIGAAFAGAGVYALVAAVLTSAITNTLLAWLRLAKGHISYRHFRMGDTVPLLRYGSYLIGEQLANTLSSQADVLIGGLFAKASLLGNYSVPRNLTLKLTTTVNPIITRVGFPTMARMQDDPSALRSTYLATVQMACSTTFPAYMGAILYAPEIIHLLYGPQWSQAAQYLRIAAIGGVAIAIGNPIGSLLHAVGRMRLALLWNIITLLLLPPILWWAANMGGILGMAVALAVYKWLLVMPAWKILILPSCGASSWQFTRAWGTPLLLAALAGAISYLIAAALPWHGIGRLVIGVMALGLAYVAFSWRLNSQWVRTILDMVPSVFRFSGSSVNKR